MPTEKSVGAIVFHMNGEVKFLLLHYRAGHWDFVKGHIEENESEDKTLLRELEEETGISDVEILPDFREEIVYYFRNNEETVRKEVVFYIAKSTTMDVTISHEHQGFKWLTFGEATKQTTFDNTKGLLKKANKFLKSHKF